jgi:dTDP-4-dehydrorhamnose reductase
MAGHTIVLYLARKGHRVTTFSRRKFLLCEANVVGDVHDLTTLRNVVAGGEFDTIVNCIGVLNDAAEVDKAEAVFVNTYLPHYLSSICAGLKSRVIHLSTDCVFSGYLGPYTESASTDGLSFYARSKALGEIVNGRDLTFRTSIIGPDLRPAGIGLFNWFMQQDGPLSGYANVIWNGVTTLTLAKAIEMADKDKLTGLYHLVNNATISKHDLLALFNTYFRERRVVIEKRASPTSNKSLIDTRSDFNFDVPSFEEMIVELRAWLCDLAHLYPHYCRDEKSGSSQLVQ